MLNLSLLCVSLAFLFVIKFNISIRFNKNDEIKRNNRRKEEMVFPANGAVKCVTSSVCSCLAFLMTGN